MRYDWSVQEIEALFELPFNDLIFQAQQCHRQHFNPNEIQLSTLLSIKTGGCPEDCKYCPQSAHHDTGLKGESLMRTEDVIQAAREAKHRGATRFCIGAAWREPQGRAFEAVLDMVRGIKSEGMEACATLGMLSQQQAAQLKAAGLDYYNHNLDSDPEFYNEIISTRDYQERLDTLRHVRSANMSICSGGIVGMGESRRHRAGLVAQLARMDPHPESVPINLLVRIEGTPLANEDNFDMLEFVRTIAVSRITMPASWVRLSAGRENMDESIQALCFLAGANSIFYGEKLLTADNQQEQSDMQLFSKLGLQTKAAATPSSRRTAQCAEA